MRAEDWASLVEHALWPAVVVLLGLTLRKPIAAFLGALAGRVTKVSVMSVSVELAMARPADPPWRGIGGDDVRGLVPAQQAGPAVARRDPRRHPHSNSAATSPRSSPTTIE